MFEKINLFLETLIPKDEQRINLLHILSNILGNKGYDRKFYIMNNNKILVDLIKLSFGDYYCYLPYEAKCVSNDNTNNLKGKKIAFIEETKEDRDKTMNLGYIHEIQSSDYIYSNYPQVAFRMVTFAILLCEDYRKFIKKICHNRGTMRRIEVIKLDIIDNSSELLKNYDLKEMSGEFLNLLIKIYSFDKIISSC